MQDNFNDEVDPKILKGNSIASKILGEVFAKNAGASLGLEAKSASASKR